MRDGIESKSNIIHVFENEKARRYTSQAFLSETHPFLGVSPDGVINDNETVKYRGYRGKEGHLMMGCAGLEFTRS